MILLVFPVQLFHEEKRNMEGKREISEKKDDLGWGEGRDWLTLRSAQFFHSGAPDLGAALRFSETQFPETGLAYFIHTLPSVLMKSVRHVTTIPIPRAAVRIRWVSVRKYAS